MTVADFGHKTLWMVVEFIDIAIAINMLEEIKMDAHGPDLCLIQQILCPVYLSCESQLHIQFVQFTMSIASPRICTGTCVHQQGSHLLTFQAIPFPRPMLVFVVIV